MQKTPLLDKRTPSNIYATINLYRDLSCYSYTKTQKQDDFFQKIEGERSKAMRGETAGHNTLGKLCWSELTHQVVSYSYS